MTTRAIAAVAAAILLMAFCVHGQETIVYEFPSGADGAKPIASLIKDKAGNFYGTTYSGGVTNGYCWDGCGTVYELGSGETVLYRFNGGTDGAHPVAALIRDEAGNLYGTTTVGGTSNYGTAFKLSTTGTKTVLHNFAGGLDGGVPNAGLVADTQGNAYGTTYTGGSSGLGVVFRLDKTGKFTVLHHFAGRKDGANPNAALIRDAVGTLYGTTTYGGLFNHGTVFKLDGAGKETVLHSFAGPPSDGAYPLSSLVADAAGDLFGTTYQGGSANWGTIFVVSASGKEAVLHTFLGMPDGKLPNAGLILGKAGTLYGSTFSGGDRRCPWAPQDGCGTVFKVNSAGNETVLYSFFVDAFHSDDGAFPTAALFWDARPGTLYGTTENGGRNSDGIIFQLVP